MTWPSATLAGALAHQAKERPEAAAVRFIEPGGASLADSTIATLTFAELHERAASVASVLAERAEPGDRAVLLCPPGLEYVAALFGCFHAGVVAVPAYPPTSAAPDERLTRLIADSDPRAILTITAMAGLCEPLGRHEGASGRAPEAVLLDASGLSERSVSAQMPEPGDLALLQYTSGSTGDPRGVMLTHANLLANVASIASHLELGEHARGVFWLPPYHDMGLVGGILTSVVLGAETTLMSPLSFLAKPMLWLEAVTRCGGTFSAAPNFAYDLCVRKIDRTKTAGLDLSTWKSVVNGAEPVREETMDRFATHFARASFRRSAFMPAYGLAEATLLVSAGRLSERKRGSAIMGRDRGNGASTGAPALVSVGVPDEDSTLLIVDPESRRALPEGKVGEIWFRSPSVGVGYWGNEQASEATFAGTLAGDTGRARFLRTGDLGVLRDGELYVSARLKDLIIVRGQNYHPHDIELAASKADSRLRPGCLAAFEIDRGRGQEVILVAELAREIEDGASTAVFERVRARVAREVGLALDELVLIERGASAKTSSGKIRRAATRSAYLDGRLRVLALHESARIGARDAYNDSEGVAGDGAGGGSPGGSAPARGLREPRLAECSSPRQREELLHQLVLAHLSALLGEISTDAIATGRTFTELGLESHGAAELSARLCEQTGLKLPEGVCYDYPTPAALVSYLSSRLGGVARPRVVPASSATTEPIAIVGASCRYPGGVSSPAELWELVASRTDAITEFPTDRGWDIERLYDPDPDHPSTSYTRQGGFLADAADFDAEFFSISPHEALAMDPQQRLLLEGAWEALEAAGIDPTGLTGSPTGAFVGLISSDYGVAPGGRDELEGYMVTGSTPSVASGRIAYSLGLEGPAVTLDTACSSSLVAIHYACQALRQGECTLALAGGVTVLASPAGFVAFSRQRGLAPDGRCKAFGAGADGMGASEGMGMVALERLSEAERNGHRVLALARGSAVNQDGASNGLTAPNGPSQERVIRQALANAGLRPQDVDAVEAHGTGTRLGDPIEAEALIATYGQERSDGPLYLGSIKSNIGHTQAAAGVASVIKMVEALGHGLLPKTLHAEKPTPHVDWQAGEVTLLCEPQRWLERGRPRRCGVSSFGISGTNAHLILEQAPEPTPMESTGEESLAERPASLPFVISANSAEALCAQAQRLRSHLLAHPEFELVDVASTLALGRAHLGSRAAVLAENREELLTGLQALAEGEPTERLLQGTTRGPAKVAFCFSGQGSQWEGMALGLCQSSPVFAERMEACSQALLPHLGLPLGELLRTEQRASVLERVDVLQPALFAVMVSLAALWRSFGVEPAAVVGHSQGEIAAACAAGALSLEDAARVVALRARALADELSGRGGMVSVALASERVRTLIEPFGERVALAAVNGPAAAVVSGERAALRELLATCASEGVRTKEIPVDYASHSAQVEAIRARLEGELAGLAGRPSEVPLYSATAGGALDARELDGAHWFRNLRETVRFEEAAGALLESGADVIIEVSPHPVLTLALQETAEARGRDSAVVIGSLRRGEGGIDRFVRSLAEAHVHGVEVDWRTLFSSRARQVDLPTYPFQRRRYWLAPRAGADDPCSLGQAPAEHPLLGAMVPVAEGEGTLLTGRLSLQSHPWLADHAVLDTALVPGTAFLELALTAAQRLGAGAVEELTLHAPLLLEEGASQLQLAVSEPDQRGCRRLAVHSRPERPLGEEPEQWACHATGLLGPGGEPGGTAPESWPPTGASEIGTQFLYDRLAEAGYQYGPAFQGLRRAWRAGGELFAEVALDAERDGEASGFGVHPALLDSTLHALALGVLERGDADALAVPFSFSGVRLYAQGACALRVYLSGPAESPGLIALDEAGEVVLSIDSLQMRPLDQGALRSATRGGRDLYELRLRELPPPASPNGTRPRLALLGTGADMTAGVEAERYPDLAALEAAVEEGAAPPELVLVAARTLLPETELPRAAHLLTARTLELLQAFLRSEPLQEAGLVLITESALAVAEDEAPDLVQAALPGLMRSAHSEHPERFRLVDVDNRESVGACLQAARASDEPELAARQGRLYAPRVERLKEKEGSAHAPRFDHGTILLTGATGGLGALLARHLVSEHGARHLLLASRSGPAAEGAGELQAELEAQGCEVTLAACDVADREQLERLLASIPQARPLIAVIHAAGVLDDGVISSLDSERLARVMAPKVDAALHLHELTKNLERCELILYSSAAGILGGPGQGNYAAANAFLDALAAHRRARGLPGRSLAWGAWETKSAMTATLGEADRARLMRTGVTPLSETRGLELFDAACASEPSLVLPWRLDSGALRAQARAGTLPAPLRSLVRAPARRAQDAAGSLARRLAGAPESEWEAIILQLVRSHVAAILGHASREAIDPERTFRDLGLDSLGAVEFRNRLAQATGMRLPATLVFDHPTPVAVAALLRARADGQGQGHKVLRRTPVDEPIAIVGLSCRYPGGVYSPADLWELVASGSDAIAEFPTDRGWELERLYDPDPDHPGTSYTRHGGFIYDAGDFDARFFQISASEALAMDPQQRLLLEGAWQAFEDAGIDPSTLRGSQTGVFTGVISSDYGLGPGSPPDVEGLRLTGSTPSVASGRLSYTFGLEGPAVSVDTACSSSLVAIHLACQALRQGECEFALAGGVTVISSPGVFIEFSRHRGLAHDGRCKSFGAAADGTGFSEGIGIVVLERLSEAQRNGHDVLALIRGSAVNQDGASNGLTAPNGPSQERVIQRALANAGLQPADVDVVEAHGTGTTLGDPIEAQALLATYGRERSEGPLYLGSIKSNIGHTQAAAGVASVIKMVLALQHGLLPRTLHAEEPSPHVDWSEGAVQLLGEEREWVRNGRPRRAGVSSFGVSGTNAHLILEETPVAAEPVEPERAPRVPEPSVVPFAVSASDEDALREQAERLRSYLAAHPELAPLDVAATLALHRSHLSHRAVIVSAERDSLIGALEALAHGDEAEGLVRGRSAGVGKLAFCFSGQGSQWAGMGRELYDAFPLFADALDEACAALDGHLERPLKEVLFAAEGSAEASLLDRTELTQPALLALEVALYRLVTSFGLRPDYLIGHSIGELSAACLASVLTLQDAATLVAARARLMGALPQTGAMLAVSATEEEVLESLAGRERQLSLAAVNAPEALVVSGDEDAIAELESHWQQRGRKTKRLRVSHAFHSALMEPMLDEFRRVAEGLSFSAPQVPIISNVSGSPLTAQEATSPAYWASHIRRTVRFADGIASLAAAGVTRFLELGPDGTLSRLAAQCLDGREQDGALFASALRARRPQTSAFVGFLAHAHSHGVKVDWGALFKGRCARRVELPTYAFQRKRYWLEPRAGTADAGALGLGAAKHPLLDASTSLADRDAWLFSGRISLHTHAWLAENTVLGAVVLPASAALDLALHAGSEVGCEEIAALTLEAPVVLPEEGGIDVQVSVSEPGDDGRRALVIASRPACDDGRARAEWRRHARGALAPAGSVSPMDDPGEVWPPRGARSIELDYLRDRLTELGVSYRAAFAGLRAAWLRENEVFVEVEAADQSAEASLLVDPALVDSIIQASALEAGAATGGVLMACAFSGVSARPTGSSVLRARLTVSGDVLALAASDEDGRPVLAITEVLMRPLDAGMLRSGDESERDLLLGLRWVKVGAPARGRGWRGVGVLGDAEIDVIGAERYADLGAVGDALGAGAPLRSLLVPLTTDDESPAGIRDAAQRANALLQRCQADERLRDLHVVFRTTGAVAARGGEAPNLAGAAVWGVVRNAQSEQPGRFTLADLDGTSASCEALQRGLSPEESQLAIREGEVLLPRLSPREGPLEPESLAFDPDGTVLITGGTGQLGRLLARHLARAHSVRHLMLASRSGPGADGAAELQSELAEFGCAARVVACDVADRRALEQLLAGIPPCRPLTAVIHAAGILDDGLVASLDRACLERVMALGVDAAIALDELTAERELCAFVLISSAVATLGGAAQASYAAANAVLDAIAQRRRACGLPAQSLAFGRWQPDAGAAAEPAGDALAYLESQIHAQMWMRALEPERGLALFDASLAAADAFLLPIRVDMDILRANAQVDAIPPVLRGFMRGPKKREDPARALRRRVLSTPGAEREAILLELVSEEVVAVVGCAASEIDGERTLVELGGESLGALELRKRLEARSGVRLPTRLLLGEPLRALTGHLREAIEDQRVHRGSSHERSASLLTVLANARESGALAEWVSALEMLSRSRATFDRVAEPSRAVRLTTAGSGPQLICIPSFMAGSGPLQFARLARGFEGRRRLSALHLPGSRIDERAPATLGVAVTALCEAVQTSAGEEPYVLVGYSSGGGLAHAMAERLEGEGGGPAGVVMIDPYARGDGSVFAAMLAELIDRSHEYLEIDDGELVAMGTFVRLASEWRAGVVRAPAFHLHAARTLAALADAEPLSVPFQEPVRVASLDADHFTIIEEHAHASAAAIDAWLRELPGYGGAERGSRPIAAAATRGHNSDR